MNWFKWLLEPSPDEDDDTFASELPENRPEALLEPCCSFISLVSCAIISDWAPPAVGPIYPPPAADLGSVRPSNDFFETARGSKKAPLDVTSTFLFPLFRN